MEEKLIPKVFARTHPLLTEATVNYGVIHGGTQLSTVAGECDLFVDTRFLPYQEYDDVIGEFQALLDELAAKDLQFKCEMSVAEEAALPEGYVSPFTITARKSPRVRATIGVTLTVYRRSGDFSLNGIGCLTFAGEASDFL